jgi:PPK2 family polyphosphate:nucleotide phosphotransferase
VGVSDWAASLRVEPGQPAALAARAPDDQLGLEDKATAGAQLDRLLDELGALHDRLWAEASRSVLLVLQGLDTAGKDGAIKRVVRGVNPQGVRVVAFKAPDEQERAHDYLWRIHAQCPPRGRLGVFNRSHYEDVVAALLVGAVDRDGVERRYRHLREFERMLVDEGTTLVKVFLHISRDEQRERLQARLDDPNKRWKFKLDDLETRSHWGEYQVEYEQVLTATSTDWAPWHVVPANRKWVRDVAVATLLLETLRALDPQYPSPDPQLDGIVVD